MYFIYATSPECLKITYAGTLKKIMLIMNNFQITLTQKKR